jgi:hypothetical protein
MKWRGSYSVKFTYDCTRTLGNVKIEVKEDLAHNTRLLNINSSLPNLFLMELYRLANHRWLTLKQIQDRRTTKTPT